MKTIASYPIFEADQVLTNNHLNDTVNYLERQDRLSRIRLIGNGIVCGLEIAVADDTIHINGGYGITSQGYLIQHCQQEYTHYIGYESPEIPGGLNLIAECGDEIAGGLPYYGMEGVFELVAAGAEVEGKQPLSSVKKHEYVVVLLLEAKQVKLKNCDTNDCNDKGGRLDFEVKPLLVHVSLLSAGEESVFNTILLKRYGVPAIERMESGEHVLDAFYDIVDDNTLSRLAQNLTVCWSRYAGVLGLEQANPFEKLDLRAIRDKFSYHKGNFHYIQYFYDFIDDLVKAFSEFKEKALDFSGACDTNEAGFPLHLALGLASESTRFGYWDSYRRYFAPVHHRYGKQNLKEEISLLLQRMQHMVADFDITLPSESEDIRITPSYIGNGRLSDRCIPFYYQPGSLYKWWDYKRSRNGEYSANLGYQLSAGKEASEAVKNPLLYDIERYTSFRIEGHVGKRYSTALAELVAQRNRYNLPFDVVALSAVDLDSIANGNEVTCNVQDLESNYNVMIAGLLCRVEQILTYVGGLRPKRDSDVGDIRVIDGIKGATISRLPTFSKKVTAIKSEVAFQKRATTTPVKENVNYIGRIVDLGTEDEEVKLMDFVAKDINSFLVADRRLFEYVLPKPDLLLVFLQQLNAIFAYLFEHKLSEFDVDAYSKLWASYQSTVNSIIKESANSQNEELKAYFSPKNNNVLFNCANEELYAIREAYNERLERYQEAVTFATYFDKHRGFEHKAGVPKGGTFILVYQPPAPRYAAVIPEKEIRVLDRLAESDRPMTLHAVRDEKLGAKETTVRDLSGAVSKTSSPISIASNNKRYSDTVSLIEKLGLGADASKVLDALKRREAEEKLISKLPGGCVIADFYVPYMCKSNCPPIAYVFPSHPEEPTDPTEPDETTPTVSVEPMIFCVNDSQKYAIKRSPEGGKLTINGKVSEAEFVPAQLGKGTFKVEYALPSKATAHTQFTVEEEVEADFEIATAKYSEREGNWELTLKSNTPADDKLKSQWLVDGKAVAENETQLIQVLTPNNPKTAITYSIIESLCGKGEQARTFIRDEQAITVNSEAESVSIPLKITGAISLVAAPKGVTVKENTLIIPPAQMAKEGLRGGIVAYYCLNADQVVLAVLTITLGTAAFEVSFGIPSIGIVPTRRAGRNAVSIALKALSGEGKSTWTINGKPAKASANIPITAFEQLKELVITHEIAFGDGAQAAIKTFAQPIKTLRKQLEAGKGTITVN